ncbi:unnamed protein product [Cylicocyclus nassatus]|uniref:Secreted protein n=1 Tax=Cylicocyclus nassatus TaxID=53992 RepID=A0AA36DK59_CYLNA|nr:unnamed protein product [Cylicocyclus nassatus]
MRLLLLLCASSVMVLSGPVYIDELEDLLPRGADKRELEMLDDDKYMIRSEKQRRLDAILQRQPDYIQQTYKAKVAQKQAQRASKQQYKQIRADQQGRGSFVAEEIAIDNDMGISSAEADRREYKLKRRYYAANPSLMFDDD